MRAIAGRARMNLIKFLLRLLLEFLKILSYRWIVDGIDIVKRGLQALKNFWDFQKLPHPVQEEIDSRCEVIDNPAFHRPDPCIYSQQYLLQLGLAVTWDNPDIVLRKGGVIVTEHDLEPDTEYEIDATIWNNSYEAPVVGLKVDFSFLTFGVATVITPIGTTDVSLGVKGGVNHPAHGKMLWKTPPVAGHFCLQVALVWFDDANPANNLGQNNVDVVAAASPATFSFRLRNNTDKANQYRFEVDTYVIPAQDACKPTIPPEDRGPRAERLRRIRAKHNRANFPVPPGWTVVLTPAEIALNPADEVDIAVVITPPAGFTGQQPFNVNAIYGGKYAGGVSLVVTAA
jgi:hypothetical protein